MEDLPEVRLGDDAAALVAAAVVLEDGDVVVVTSTLFCPDVVREVMELEPTWEPMGALAVGHAASPASERVPRGPEDYVVVR